MWGKHLNCAKLQKHIAKLRKRNSFWQLVGSQAVEDICQRIEKAYQLFFKHQDKGVKPPGFKKVKKYKSFTLKQAGYKFLGGNRFTIGNQVYQYWNSRAIEGTVKTLTIKRTPLGELFMFVTVEPSTEQELASTTGKTAGFDFGLKMFLVCSEGFSIEAPFFFKQGLKAIQKASRELSRKKKGSANWERARLNLVRQHEKIAHQRRDWFWKLAHSLTDRVDVLCFEDLTLKGMQRLWGRKVNDLAFGEFLQTLQWVAKKKGKVIQFIDRWFPSSKTCHHCGHVLERLSLEARYWRCPSCSNLNDWDDNAAKNIKAVGASTAYTGRRRKMGSACGCCLTGESLVSQTGEYVKQ